MLLNSKGFGSPKIYDNCLIGTGAKIIENITIGDNCLIEANAVVSNSLPVNTVFVYGKEPILKTNLNNRIYQLGKEGWKYIENGKFIPEKSRNDI